MPNRVSPLRRLALSGLAIAAACLTAWTYSTVGSSAQHSFDDLDDPPVLSLPADITAISADPAGAPVTYRATAEDDDGNNLTVNCSHPSGSVFPLNMTTVTCAATDRRGQTTTGTFAVTVLTVGPISKTRVIDFERFPGPDGVLGTSDDVCAQDRDVLSTQYEKLGVSSFVLSNNAHPTIYRHDDPYIQGSPASLHPVSLADRNDHPGDQRFLRDFQVNFSLDVFRVKISGLNADEPMTLEAFDDAGELIASARRGAGGDRSVVPIEVRVDGSRGFIRKVRLNLRQGTERCCDGGPEYYDMLEFDPAAQLPVPSNTTHIDFENYPGADGALGTADDTPARELDELFTKLGAAELHKYDAVGARFGLLDGRFTSPPSLTVRESAFVYVPGSPRSLDPRSKVEREAGCGEKCLKDFEINFTNPVTRVKLAALNADEVVRLRAYSAAGGPPIATASRGRGGDRAVHFIEVRVDPCQPPANLIHRVVVDLEESGDPIGPELYDLLEFDPVVTNRAPVASTLPVSTFEDRSVDFTLGAADPDAGDALTFTVLSQPSHGTLSADGADLRYTPDPDYHGPDSFTYKADDGAADSNVATVHITVTPVNDTPVARPETYDVQEDATLSVAARGVLDNDTDADEGETEDLDAVLVGAPPPGQFTLNPDGSFSYTPPADSGEDVTFSYAASDGRSLSAAVTVLIRVAEVNDAPVALDDNAETFEDSSVSVDVLANDRDADGAPSVAGVTHGADGTVAVNADGTLTYTPNRDFYGTDGFTYTLDDGRGGTATASVTVRVLAVNDAPVASFDEYDTDEDVTLSVPAAGVLGNDTDVDDKNLTASLVGDASHGALVLNPDGSFNYEPAPNFYGTDFFTYVARDLAAGSARVTVKITVRPVNDAPAASPDGYGVAEDGTLTVAAEDGVLGNDTDVEEAALTARLLSQPSHGALTFNPDGSFIYTPRPDYYGPDGFTYKAADATSDSGPATVTLNVGEVNDAPSAAPDSRGTHEDTALTFAADTLLPNDAAGPANEGAQTLTVAGVADRGDARGTVTLDAGVVTYSPAANYHGPASFEYTVCDDGTTAGRPAPLCTTGVVSVGVAPVNDAPAAADRSFGTDEDTPAAFTLVTVPTDVDGDEVQLESVTQPSHGSVIITGRTTVSYTPSLNYHGPDGFTYTVTDGKGGTATAAVLLTIRPVNDPPAFIPLGPLTADAGAPLTFTLGATDPDAGDTLTFTSPNLPPGATLTPQGVFNWTACYLLTSANITFVVTDSGGASDTMTVAVNVVGALDQLHQLSAYLDGLGLRNATYEPIDADLDFAINHYDPNKPSKTCDGLRKFIDGVRQREDDIGSAAAARLINAAQALQRTLGCGGGPGSGCQ